MAYQWKTWGNGTDKKGFLQSQLICYTYAYHRSCVAAIPGSYPRLKAPPVGALLLSMQAVERALQFWRTGEHINPHNSASHFSIENWGDHADPNDKRTSERTLIRHATKYLPTVKNWPTERWDELNAAAAEFIDLGNRKRGASSRSASDASGDDLVPEEDVIIVSD
ncbi:hypothetical protein FB451DRAFT_184415 [Mycena latifolia]|nr:hypothetical protein FB451DRAFT_184415 [Mycena latifolia]